MIVIEKTRDIGILKALGASNGGVMKIFLGYGLLLGVVGAGLGTCLGVTMAMYINEIEQWLTRLTGQQDFQPPGLLFRQDPDGHPADDAWCWSNVGAIADRGAVQRAAGAAGGAAASGPALRYE